MVQFGHQLQASLVPGWEAYYLQYKQMKKAIKAMRLEVAAASAEQKQEILRQFAEMLDFQVEKMVLFQLQRQGELATALMSLQQEYSDLKRPIPRTVAADLAGRFRQLGSDLLRLLEFVELNVKGLSKIMKKFEKQTQMHLAKAYITSRTNHPNSQVVHLMRTVGAGALAGCIARNLADLKKRELGMAGFLSRKYSFSLYRQSSLPSQVEQEPVIQEIQAVRDRLALASPLQRFLAATSLIDLDKPMVGIRKSPSGTALEEETLDLAGLLINLGATFLYMVNYYVIVPSSDDYATLLGAPATICGIMIGAMPIAALISAFIYSAWSNRSYTEPLLVSTVILVAGNAMYAMALPLSSVWLVLLGRAFCGLGGARAINRRYISDHVPVKLRLKASAGFVSASALGMAAGPALAGLMDRIDISFGLFTLNYVTAPGWLLTVAWAAFLIAIIFSFKEPRRDSTEAKEKGEKKVSGESSSRLLEEARAPLLASAPSEAESLEDEDLEETFKPATTLTEVYREFTTPVVVTLFTYFMLKFATEILISESSIVTKFYFHWQPSSVGIFLSLLGLTVLPVNTIIGQLASRLEDRKLMLITEIMTAGGTLIMFCIGGPIPYTVAQYVIGAVVIFVSTCALEGVSMALLSRTMPLKLSSGTFNAGLLSTEAGTLARAVADVMITGVGRFGMSQLLNLSLLPTFVLALVATLYTSRHYKALKCSL